MPNWQHMTRRNSGLKAFWLYQYALANRKPLPAVLASSILALSNWFYVSVLSVNAGVGKIGGALGGGTSVGGFGAFASFSLR